MTVSVSHGGITIAAEEETALRLLYLREQFADSALWRALVALPRSNWNDVKAKADLDDADRNAALEAVEFDHWTAEKLNEVRDSETPRILLRPYDESDTTWTTPDSWNVSDLFLILIHIPVPDDLRDLEYLKLACIDFWNKTDRIKKEVMRSGQFESERVNFPGFARIVLPGEINPDQNNGRRVRQSAYAITARGTSS